MADQTKYNPSIAWSTIAANVVQLTRADVDDPATYRITVSAVDTQEPGAETKDTDCYFTDNLGFPYSIIATASTTIDVEDSFRVGHCPTSGKIGYIHMSAYKGKSLFLPSFAFRKLHPLAQSNNNKFAMSILWGNDTNAIRIPFTATATPTISNYQDDQVINSKTVNLAEDFGINPHFLLMITVDANTEHPNYQPPVLNYVDGLLDSIVWEWGEEITGYIKIFKT